MMVKYTQIKNALLLSVSKGASFLHLITSTFGRAAFNFPFLLFFPRLCQLAYAGDIPKNQGFASHLAMSG